MRPKNVDREAAPGTEEASVASNRRQRDGRGWGPFSGAQLTVIIVAIAVMILLPIGAFAAVTGSNVFVTDSTSGKTQVVNSLGQAQIVIKGKTALIAQGTAPVDPFTTVSLFTEKNVSDWANVRLFVSETGANPNSQIGNVYSSVVPYVLDNFVMNTNDVTRLYNLPGTAISFSVSNNSADQATYIWRLYGRSN